jgi:hypothetical protein
MVEAYVQIDYLFVMGLFDWPITQKLFHIMDSLKMEEYATSFPFGLAM